MFLTTRLDSLVSYGGSALFFVWQCPIRGLQPAGISFVSLLRSCNTRKKPWFLVVPWFPVFSLYGSQFSFRVILFSFPWVILVMFNYKLSFSIWLFHKNFHINSVRKIIFVSLHVLVWVWTSVDVVREHILDVEKSVKIQTPALTGNIPFKKIPSFDAFQTIQVMPIQA